MSAHAEAIDSARAPLEPAEGAYFGMSIDWERDSVPAIGERLGLQPAVYAEFVSLPLTSDDHRSLDRTMEQVRAVDGIVLLTLEPTVSLDAITDEIATEAASVLAKYEAEGAAIFVRFAHEMNGSWYPWGQQPTAYIKAFRTVARAIRERSSHIGMIWAPNIGEGYPYAGGPYLAGPDDPDFPLLDTNNDGLLTQRDDPYAPYYPGDDVVDWISVSLYHWGHEYPWESNDIPLEGTFLSALTGSPGKERGLYPDLHADYAVGRGKPLAIMATAAFYQPDAGGSSELEVKQAWWRQVFSATVAHDFPRIKMIVWFEWRKAEPEVDGAIVDWTVTADATVRDAFRVHLAGQGWLRFAPVETERSPQQ